MKLCVKKTWCGNCKMLVGGEEKKVDNTTQIFCLKCKQPIWQHESASWKSMRQNVLKKD